MTTSAREESSRLADLLHREHHAMADFLVALGVFDRDQRWAELGYASLFDYLHRHLALSSPSARRSRSPPSFARPSASRCARW
jgi:hypothetical protein